MKKSLLLWGLVIVGGFLFFVAMFSAPLVHYHVRGFLLGLKNEAMERIEKRLVVASRPEADELFQQLEPFRQSSDPYVRSNLAHFLGEVSATTDPYVSERAVTLLLELLEDPSDRVTLVAMQSLGDFGPRATVAIPQLEAIIRTQKGSLDSINAINALGAMASHAKGSVPLIAEALSYEIDSEFYRDWVRIAAAEALKKMGKDAAPALPALRAVSKVGDIASQKMVAKAIAAIERDGKAEVMEQ